MQRTTNFDSSELRSLFPSACHQFDQSAKQTIHTFLWNQSSRFFNGKPNVLFQKVLVNRNFNGLPPNFCKAVNHLYSSDPEDLQRLFYTHILNCLYFSLSKRKIPRSKSSIYHKPRQRIKSREASKFDPLSPSVESLLETIHWLLFADNCAFNKNFTFTDVKDFIKCLLPIAFRVNVVRDFKDSHMLQKGQLSLWMRLQHFQIPDIPAFQNKIQNPHTCDMKKETESVSSSICSKTKNKPCNWSMASSLLIAKRKSQLWKSKLKPKKFPIKRRMSLDNGLDSAVKISNNTTNDDVIYSKVSPFDIALIEIIEQGNLDMMAYNWILCYFDCHIPYLCCGQKDKALDIKIKEKPTENVVEKPVSTSFTPSEFLFYENDCPFDQKSNRRSVIQSPVPERCESRFSIASAAFNMALSINPNLLTPNHFSRENDRQTSAEIVVMEKASVSENELEVTNDRFRLSRLISASSPNLCQEQEKEEGNVFESRQEIIVPNYLKEHILKCGSLDPKAVVQVLLLTLKNVESKASKNPFNFLRIHQRLLSIVEQLLAFNKLTTEDNTDVVNLILGSITAIGCPNQDCKYHRFKHSRVNSKSFKITFETATKLLLSIDDLGAMNNYFYQSENISVLLKSIHINLRLCDQEFKLDSRLEKIIMKVGIDKVVLLNRLKLISSTSLAEFRCFLNQVVMKNERIPNKIISGILEEKCAFPEDMLYNEIEHQISSNYQQDRNNVNEVTRRKNSNQGCAVSFLFLARLDLKQLTSNGPA